MEFDCLYSLYIDNVFVSNSYSFQRSYYDEMLSSQFYFHNSQTEEMLNVLDIIPDSGGYALWFESTLSVDRTIKIVKNAKQDLVSGIVQFQELVSETDRAYATYSDTTLVLDLTKTYACYRSRTASGSSHIYSFFGKFETIFNTGTVLDGKLGFVERDTLDNSISKAITYEQGVGLTMYDFCGDVVDENIYFALHLNYIEDYENLCACGGNGWTESSEFVSSDISGVSKCQHICASEIVLKGHGFDLNSAYIVKEPGTYDSYIEQLLDGTVNIKIADITATNLTPHILSSSSGYVGNKHIVDSSAEDTGELVYIELSN